MRGARPFAFTNLKAGDNIARNVDFIAAKGGV
jgi:hypothetical protein